MTLPAPPKLTPPDGERIIVFDGNGTIRNTVAAKQKIMREFMGVKLPENVAPTRAAYAAISDEFGLTWDYISAHLHEFPEFTMRARPVPGAIEAARAVRDAGCALYVCMQRSQEEVNVFNDWLVGIGVYRYNGSPLFTDVIAAGKKPKSLALASLPFIDAIVDDTFDKIKDVPAAHKFILGSQTGLPAEVRAYENWGSESRGLTHELLRIAYRPVPIKRRERSSGSNYAIAS